MLREKPKPESRALIAASIVLSFEILLLTADTAFAQTPNLLWRATIPVGKTPIGVAVDPSTNTVYVANSDSGTISVISGLTNKVTDTIKVGVKPDGVAVSPSTNTIYVTDAATYNASVISGSTNSVIATIRVGS